MCGRFTLATAPEIVAELFELAEIPPLTPRYNVAPSQPIPAVIGREGGGRACRMFRWGLIPSWSKDDGTMSGMINARAETVASKPSFRSAFRKRRCLIPADGFYEWQKQEGRKQPYYIQLADRAPFAFAGLFDQWKPPEGEPIDSCAIITTEPNPLMAPIHNRMPVILRRGDYRHWLSAGVDEFESLGSLLVPYPADEMVAVPVGLQVNNPGFDAPACTCPLP